MSDTKDGGLNPAENPGTTSLIEETVTGMEPVDIAGELKNMKGALADSVRRNNKQIRADRGLNLVESIKMKYKRIIEDLQLDIRKKKIDQGNLLDFSPTNADSLILGKDLDETNFVKQDQQLSIDIENLSIRLRLAVERYKFLFGENAIH
jgi:hypothetical protein